jgi:hypothetical protein
MGGWFRSGRGSVEGADVADPIAVPSTLFRARHFGSIEDQMCLGNSEGR